MIQAGVGDRGTAVQCAQLAGGAIRCWGDGTTGALGYGNTNSIVAVANGAEALRLARENPPDLILADVMMPELDGFGLLQALRADPRTLAVPVFLVSARAGEEARVEDMQAGADDYLTKPFSSRELLARVDAHLALAHLRREAGESVRATEERFQAFMDNTPALAYIKDEGGRYVFINRSTPNASERLTASSSRPRPPSNSARLMRSCSPRTGWSSASRRSRVTTAT